MKNADRPPKTPLALHARNFLNSLPKIASLKEVSEELKSFLEKPAVVSRLRRFALTAGFMAWPVFTLIAFSIMIPFVNGALKRQPEILALSMALGEHKAIKMTKAGRADADAEQEALEIYISGNFRSMITNPTPWNSIGATSFITPDKRQIAEKIIARRGIPSEKELALATATVNKRLGLASIREIKQLSEKIEKGLRMAAPITTILSMFFITFLSLIAALLFRGGLVMYLAEVAVVNTDGSPGSRAGVFRRNLTAFLPLILLFAIMTILFVELRVDFFLKINRIMIGVAAIMGLHAILTVISLALPDRSLQDRISGTWLVPR